MPNPFWIIKAKANSKDSAELRLYGVIGEDDYWDDITAKQFSDDLKEYADVKNIDIRINSPGGSVFAGQAIYSMLKRHSAYKTAYIDGLAGSIASLIPMAANKVIMPVNSMMMVHKPWGPVVGNADKMRKTAETYDKIGESMAAVYQAKTGLSKEEILQIMSDETWMSADEAVEKGFADEIEAELKIAACIEGNNLKINGQDIDITKFKNFKNEWFKTDADPSGQKPEPPAIKPKRIVNSDKTKERGKTMELKALCAKLGLNYDTLIAAGRTDEQIEALVISKVSVDNSEAAVKAEQQRNADIIKLGQEYNAKDLAIQFISEGKPVGEFKDALLKAQKDSDPTPTKRTTDKVGLDEAEARSFSFIKLVNAMVNPTDKSAIESAKFELEACQAAADKYGTKKGGTVIPIEVLTTSLAPKAAAGDVTSTVGTKLIGTDLLMSSFIDLLRNKTLLMQLTTKLTGLIGNVDIPKQTAGSSWYLVGEDTAPTASNPTFDQISFALKTIAARCYLTRQMKKQTSLDMEAFLRNDLAVALAAGIDYLGLYGNGTTQPKGIKASDGINTVQFAAANPTYSELVAMETEVSADNADVDSMAYIFNARMRGHCKSTQKFPTNTDGSGVIWEPGKTVNGYSALITNQVENGDVFFGNFADLIIGMWGGLELTVDPFSNSTKGGINIVAFQDFDLGIRHGASFCYGSTDLTNSTGSTV